MSTLNWTDTFLSLAAGVSFGTIIHYLFKKPEPLITEKEIETGITCLKISIKTKEIIGKNYEEAIKTTLKELEEALKVSRENPEDESLKEAVKNKREQLDELESLCRCEMDDLKILKNDLKDELRCLAAYDIIF